LRGARNPDTTQIRTACDCHAMKFPPDPRLFQTLPCRECRARCCRYVSVEIDRPTSKRDYDTVRWYLLHKNIHVFVDHDRKWFVEFMTECEELASDQSCGSYLTRPQVCRDHGWPIGSCEFFADPCLHYFRTAPEFERYLDRKEIDWRWKRRPRHGEAT
jgi:hypothetical protein